MGAARSPPGRFRVGSRPRPSLPSHRGGRIPRAGSGPRGSSGPGAKRARIVPAADRGATMSWRGVGEDLHGAEELAFIKGNFDDPGQEWRRMFSESLGAFVLALVAARGG